MKKLLTILILLRTFTANAVDYKFNVMTYPDSCQIYMNGETMGSSPCVFKYPLDFINVPEYACTLVVAKAGYISDTIRFTKKRSSGIPQGDYKGGFKKTT